MKSNYYNRFLTLQEEAKKIIESSTTYNDPYTGMINHTVNTGRYNKWNLNTKVLIEAAFGADSIYLKSFVDAENKRNMKSYYERMVESLKPILDALVESFENIEEMSDGMEKQSELEIINNLCMKFPLFARQMQKRHSQRQPFEIKDEYDVQDLFHALLKIHFDDIRPEEYTPSKAGSASRVDFLLKKEKIVIEIKMTRKNLGAKELGNELIIDINRYTSHQDCKTLVCFVYDPEGYINNPSGIENDLESTSSDLKIKVNILPK